MSYDKESFLAGITVGTQLKGWASADGIGGGPLSEITVRSQPTTFDEIPADGFYGIGRVTVEGDEHLTADNIKKGIEILGVTGTYSPKEVELQIGKKRVTSNGDWTFKPEGTAIGFSKLEIDVDVPTEVVAQEKTVTPRKEGWVLTPDDGYNALSKVTVNKDDNFIADNIKDGIQIFGVTGAYKGIVDANLQDKKTHVPGRYGKSITPDEGYDGLKEVYVSGDNQLIPSNIREGVEIFGVTGSYSTDQKYQAKTITPTAANLANGFNVIADSGYNALSQVQIKGNTNFKASNIAEGVTMFGVTGTYVSPMKTLTVIPSVHEQVIIPTDEYKGFNEVIVLASEATGEYNEGYADGAASKEAEIAELEARILALTIEKELAYAQGYEAGWNDGATQYVNFDTEAF